MYDIILLLAVSTVFAFGSYASPVKPSSVYRSIPSPPAPWKQSVSQLSSAVPLRLRIALSLPETIVQSLALNLSDPTHPSYGSHLSQTALSAVLAPSTTGINQVTSWLQASGAENISTSGGGGGSWVEFHTTTGHANEFLNTNFERFSCSPDDREELFIIRSLKYSVPADIAELVDFIHPVTHFPRIKPAKEQRDLHFEPGKRTTAQTTPPGAVKNDNCYFADPTCLAAQYNVNYAAPANETSPSRIGVLGFLENYPNHEWVKTFLETNGLPANRTPVDFTIDWINFPTASSIPVIDNTTAGTTEALLDLEYAMALTNPMPVTYFYTAGRGSYINDSGVALQLDQSGNEPYLEFLEHFLSLENPPQVLSFSYSDTEKTVPLEYARRICNLFAAVAARGVSVLVASGDGGVAGAVSGDTCVSNDGKNTPQFNPTFPSSCPWVTSVGATNQGTIEIAATYSSGGFSNYFTVPDWQANATSSYISKLNGTYDGLYNKSGRAMPDISAAGSRYLVTYANGKPNGNPRGVKGTSASTPTLAGMIALLNDERLRNGKSSLGWLNPLLYSKGLAKAWNDIIEESNPECDTDGFPALHGWDPVTGVGSPKFDVLRGLVN